MDCRAIDYRMKEARGPTPCSLMPVPPGYRYPQGTGIKDTLFNCNDPPCSLLVLTNIIYNHVSTGRVSNLQRIRFVSILVWENKQSLQIPQPFLKHLDIAWCTHFGEHVQRLLVSLMSAFQVTWIVTANKCISEIN